MNRTEQKERLTDIIDAMSNAIVVLKDHTSFYEEMVQDYTDLYEKIDDQLTANSILELNEEEFASALTKSILEEHADLDNLSAEIEEFKDDLEYYKEEISESRAEKLEERYGDLEEVYDSVYGLTEDGEITLDIAIEVLEEKIVWLKQMKK